VARESEHGTWVNGRCLAKDKLVELKLGMILTFGNPDGMSLTA